VLPQLSIWLSLAAGVDLAVEVELVVLERAVV
jgi:hypothetical protein